MAGASALTAPPEVLSSGLNQPAVQAGLEKIKTNDLPFDPIALKEKYLEERDKRLRQGRGLEQYRPVEGTLEHYLRDPWVKPGFKRDAVEEEVDVVIIGGGYGAQLMAVRLIEAGVNNFKLIEKAGDFGGTWYWNRYPGAQCDIESYVYMPLLEELGYMPTEKYARANELLKHSEMIGRKYDLYRRTMFQTEVTSMNWDELAGKWITRTTRGDQIRSRFVVPAAGPLHRPKLGHWPGIERFKGHSFHTSRWDYDYTGGDTTGNLSKLSDKKIGIIGTGATAVQIVPRLGEWAKHVYVFQRTPSSIDVRGNRPTDPEWAGSLKPGWQKERMDNFNEIVNGAVLETDLVQDGWTDILQKLLARPKPGVRIDPREALAARRIADFEKMESIRARCDELVKDRKTAQSLKPWYNQLCKRPCFHDEYLQSFNLPNVELIDTDGVGVEAITEEGILANGKVFEVDCIIYATGFELSTDWSHRTNIEIVGRGGQTITEKWKDGTCTLHSWTSRDFPNCFFVNISQAALSPNFIHVTGEQAKHIAYVVGKCKKENIRTIEPTAEAEQRWTKTIVQVGQMRATFLEDCTPGYYNSEGQQSMRTRRNATYGPGAPAFIKILEEWRAKDNLEGLDVVYNREKSSDYRSDSIAGRARSSAL